MPQQRSRTRAVIPGAAILGKAGAAKAEASTVGGAVVPGRAILGDLAESELKKVREARALQETADAKQATGPAPTRKKADDSGLPPKLNPRAASKAEKAPAPKPSLSEGEVVAMLQADPESWEHVLDVESERPDGIRPAVAAALLKVESLHVEAPEEAIDALKALAGDA